MKHSEFHEALTAVFGVSYATAVLHDLALPTLRSRTAAEALAAGIAPQLVWDAVCLETQQPPEARFHHRRQRDS